MKRRKLIIIIVIICTLIIGCSSEYEAVEEAIEASRTEESTVVTDLAVKLDEIKDLSSDGYQMDRAIINCFKDKNFDVNVIEWRFISEETIYILDNEGREFIVDKSNVTFFSSPLS